MDGFQVNGSGPLSGKYNTTLGLELLIRWTAPESHAVIIMGALSSTFTFYNYTQFYLPAEATARTGTTGDMEIRLDLRPKINTACATLLVGIYPVTAETTGYDPPARPVDRQRECNLRRRRNTDKAEILTDVGRRESERWCAFLHCPEWNSVPMYNAEVYEPKSLKGLQNKKKYKQSSVCSTVFNFNFDTTVGYDSLSLSFKFLLLFPSRPRKRSSFCYPPPLLGSLISIRGFISNNCDWAPFGGWRS
ncbi:hypothetical protein DFH09DRAFT_1458650 [Mycena vulgaris]|nr:hypothetical protein DFH09DRAFT_1458650 [Mycena vulgaris]